MTEAPGIDRVDEAIVTYGACAICSVGGWLTWHAGPCPEIEEEGSDGS